MRKKAAVLALILAAALSISACAPSGSTGQNGSASSAESQSVQQSNKFGKNTEAYYFDGNTGTWLTIKDGTYELNSFDIKYQEKGTIDDNGGLCSDFDKAVHAEYIIDGDKLVIRLNGSNFELISLSAEIFESLKKEYLDSMYSDRSEVSADESSAESSYVSDDESSAESSYVSDDESSAVSGSEFIDLDSDETVDIIKAKMQEEAVDGVIKITVWCSSDDVSFEKTLVADFEEKFSQSGTELDIEVRPVGAEMAASKIIEEPSEGADVFSFSEDTLSSLVESRDISPVAAYYSDSVAGANTSASVAASSVDDDLYAFPISNDDGYFLYYDKRVLSEEDVKTFDGMIEKANASGKSVFMDLNNAWYATGFFLTAGCDINYTDGKQTAAFGTTEGLAAAKAICHISESQGKGYEGYPGPMGDIAYVKSGFEDGTLAAAVIGTWVAPELKLSIGEDNIGAAKLPTVLMDGEQKQLESFGGHILMGINSFSKVPFSAQTLAYFLSSESSQLKMHETRGKIPTNKNALDNEAVASDPATAAIEEQRPYAHPQSKTVGNIYWSCGLASVCGNIVNNYGAVSDDELMEQLQKCEEYCANGGS